jgi:hypothetical protein
MECDELAGVAAELALGALTGRERAGALAHLDQCEACRENVRRLTMTGEELFGLLPAREPPPGFEIGVMARIALIAPGPAVGRRIGRILHRGDNAGGQGDPGQTGRGLARATRRMLAVAAVTLAVVGAGLGGWGLRSAASPPAWSPLSSAALTSAGHRAVGKIYVYHGSPGWLYMSVDLGSGNGTVACRVASADGHVTTIGSFRLVNGYGAWGGPGSGDNGLLTRAWLISADGTVLATASFAGP